MPNELSPLPERTGAAVGVTQTGESEREWLDKRAADVEAFVYRQACDTVRVGAVLEAVRKRIGHGRYQAWVESSLTISLRTAHRYRLVGRAFAQFQNCQFDRFDFGALYALAQLKGVPQQARELAVADAAAGKRVTLERAAEIIDSYRPVPDPDEKEVKDYERRVRELNEVATLVPAKRDDAADLKVKMVDQDAETATLERRDAHRFEMVGRAVTELCARMPLVRVEHVTDPDGVPLYSVTCFDPDRAPTVVVDRKLRRAFERAAGKDPKKFCPGCCAPGSEGLPVGNFSDNDGMDDELAARCKQCERTRRREGRVRLKAERAATEAPGPGN